MCWISQEGNSHTTVYSKQLETICNLWIHECYLKASVVALHAASDLSSHNYKLKLTEIIGNQLIEIIMHMLQMMSNRK